MPSPDESPAAADGSSQFPPIDLAQQHRLRRQLALRQRADHYFFVDVVGTCNLRCPSCPVGNFDTSPPRGFMDPEVFQRVLDKIHAEYADRPRIMVDLYNWGEPALHPKLAAFVRLLNDYGMGSGISTNLNAFPDMEGVLRAGPDYIRISVSGYYPAVYSRTHKRGNINVVKGNLYRLRALLDRYRPDTVVQVGFHIYRSNFPIDFLKMRELCDELGYLFDPVLATLMPAEKALAAANGDVSAGDVDLLDNLVVSINERLAAFEVHGPPTEDCQFRQKRTTINVDGSVELCCAVYDADKRIAQDFLDISRSDLEGRKYDHPFCETCMTRHINKIYTCFEPHYEQQRAVAVLGPVYENFLLENARIGDPALVVYKGRFETKEDVYERGMAALAKGQDGWPESTLCFDVLVEGAPDFAEGYFQAGRLAHQTGDLPRAARLVAQACNLDPNHQGYREELERLQRAKA